jgi:hypothetical protein
MQKIAIVLVLAVLCSGNLFSQDRKMGAPLSEVRKNKNQLDLDVKNIFNGLSGATLIYKRTYQIGDLVDVNSIRLLRFSARINNDIVLKDTYLTNTSPYLTYLNSSGVRDNSLSMGLAIGVERQKASKNFVYYYGIDAGVYFDKSNFYYTRSYTVTGLLITSYTISQATTQRIEAGLSPLFGLKYYFTDRISIGIETGITVSFFSQSARETISAVDVINGTQQVSTVTYDPVKSSGIRTSFNNLKFVTVGFTF